MYHHIYYLHYITSQLAYSQSRCNVTYIVFAICPAMFAPAAYAGASLPNVSNWFVQA